MNIDVNKIKEKGEDCLLAVVRNRDIITVAASAIFSFLAWRGVKKLGGDKKNG